MESSGKGSDYRIAAAVSFGFALLCSLLVLFMPQRWEAFLGDALIYMEGAWRIQQGMRIFADFHSPIGPAYFALVDAGIRIAGFTERAFTAASLIELILLLPCAWIVFSRRFSPLWCTVGLAMLTTVVLAPNCLGNPQARQLSDYLGLSYGMQYNRVFWAVANVFLVATLMPVRRESARLAFAEAAIIGVTAGLLFFGKINFFLAAVPILALAAYAYRKERKWLLTAVCGFAVVWFLFALYRMSIPGYFADTRMLAQNQSLRSLVSMARGILRVNESSVVPVAVLAIMGWIAMGRGFTPSVAAMAVLAAGAAWRYLLIVFVFGGFGLALKELKLKPLGSWSCFDAAIALLVYGVTVTAANFEVNLIPSVFLAAVVVAEGFSRLPEAAKGYRLAANLTACGFALFAAGIDFASIVRDWVLPPAPSVARNSISPVFRSMIIPAGYNSEKTYQVEESAIELVRAYGNVRIGTDIATDFIPVLTHRQSPGGLLWFQPGRTSTEKTMPPGEVQFALADLIEVPKDPRGPDQPVYNFYTAYVRSHYRLVGQNDRYFLFKRLVIK